MGGTGLLSAQDATTSPCRQFHGREMLAYGSGPIGADPERLRCGGAWLVLAAIGYERGEVSFVAAGLDAFVVRSLWHALANLEAAGGESLLGNAAYFGWRLFGFSGRVGRGVVRCGRSSRRG